MKKFSILLVLVSTALLSSLASAATERLAEELVEMTNAGDREVAPPVAPGGDPVRREAHFRTLAARFYAEKLSEAELTDLIGFYRSAAGNRLLKMQDQIEKEVIVAAFSGLLNPGKTDVPAETAAPEADPRTAQAQELMKTPTFEELVAQQVSRYETIRGDKKAGAVSNKEYISNLYAERYARRFSKKVLTELVAFHQSKLCAKYAKLQKELGPHLEKAAARFEASAH